MYYQRRMFRQLRNVPLEGVSVINVAVYCAQDVRVVGWDLGSTRVCEIFISSPDMACANVRQNTHSLTFS